MTDFMYKTVKQEAAQEIVIRKSRYIGHARPVSTEEEAIAFIEKIKKEHWNATHNCSAYVLGMRNEIQKQSDDGEPSGTAGKPILEVLKQQELRNCVIVVTRYFGGIKLGAGGLIRAYTDGAVTAIDAAVPVRKVLHQKVSLEIEYTWQGKVENELRNRSVMIEDTVFTDKVTYHLLPQAEEADAFQAWLIDLTQGRGNIATGETLYIEHDICTD